MTKVYHANRLSLFLALFFFIAFSNASDSQTLNWQWATGTPATSADLAIEKLPGQNVYVTGSFSGTVDFDPGIGVSNLTSSGNADAFIVKTDSSGNFIWARQIGSPTGAERGTAIVVDASGNIFITGYFTGTADFDPGPGTFSISSISGTQDVFICKLDSGGNFVWAKQLGGSDFETALDIALDNSGNIYTTGQFAWACDFDPGAPINNLVASGSYDAFICKLDASGNFVWAKKLGGTSTDNGSSIVVSPSGSVYTIGSYQQPSADFDPGPGTYYLPNTLNSNLFISKLDASGNFVWAKSLNGSYVSNGRTVLLDGIGNLVLTGLFQGTTDFDPGPGVYNVNTAGYDDIYVLKLDSSGNFLWAKGMGSSNYENSYSLALDQAGNVFTTGYFYAAGDFDPGPGVFNLTPNGSQRDIFISKLDVSGNFVWAKSAGGTSDDDGYSLAVNASGNLFATGYYSGTSAMFDGITLLNPGLNSFFLGKINNTPCTGFAASIAAGGPTTFCSGSSVNLNATTGAGLSYQWKMNGADIPGANLSTYSATATGSYLCVVTSTCSRASNTLIVTVNTPPPAAITYTGPIYICNGNTTLLRANTGANLTYQWKVNGVDIGGANSYFYYATTIGNYTCVVSNVCGSTLSNSVALNYSTYPADRSFQKAYGSTGNDAARSIVNSASERYLVTGTYDAFGADSGSIYLLSLTSNQGLVGWQKIIGQQSFDEGISITQTSDQGMVVVGRRGYLTFGMVVIKLNGSSDVLWSKTINEGLFDKAMSVIETSTGEIVIGGRAHNGSNYYGLLIKLSATGNLIWSQSYPQFDDGIYSVVQATDGGFALAGSHLSPPNDINLCLVKTDASGVVQWQKSVGGAGYDGSAQSPNMLALAADSGFVLAGTTSSFGAGGRDMYLVKFTKTGNLLWTRTVGGTGDEEGNSVILAEDFGFLVAGSTNSFGAGGTDAFVTKLDAAGTMLWSRTFGGTGNDMASDIIISQYCGAFIIAGSTTSYGNGGSDVFVVEAERNASTCGNASVAYAISGSGGSLSTNFPGSNGGGGTNVATLTLVSNNGPGIVTSICSSNCTLPIASISAVGPTTFCSGNSVTLNVVTGSGYSYQWKKDGLSITGATATSYSAATSGVYACVVTNICGSSNSNNISVNVSAVPTANISANGSLNFCAGGTVVLSASTGTGYTYQWKTNGVNISGAILSTYTATNGGNYTCQVTNSCGSLISNTISVSVDFFPTASIYAWGATTFCSGQAVFITANTGQGLSYQWQADGANIPGELTSSYWATTGASYTCVVSNSCGSATSSALLVTVIPFPQASISAAGATTFCLGGAVILNATTGAGLTYQWLANGVSISGANLSSFVASSAADYQCVVTSSCGNLSSNAITVTVLSPPVANITAQGSTSFCPGGHVKLEADTSSGVRYQWMLNGIVLHAETLSIVDASAAGNYTCSVSNACDTDTSNAITITVLPPPSADIFTNNPTSFCAGSTAKLILNTDIGLTFQWQVNGVNIPGATAIDYTTGSAGNYTCIVTGLCGTTTSNTITLSIIPLPTASITAGGSTSFCAGGSVTLNASTGAGLAYQWKLNSNNITGATASSYNATAAGSYTCLVSNLCGGTTSNSIAVTINPLPSATITAGGSTAICQGSSVMLNANTGTGLTYQWKLNTNNITGATAASYNATGAGSYTCVVTNSCGNTTSNSIAVTISPLPTAAITAGGSTTICQGSSVTLNANTGAGLTYQWKLNSNNITGATAASYNATGAGSYTCLVSNTCGGTTSNSIAVTINPLPTATITAGGSTAICTGGSVTLNANTGTGLSYQWKRNATNITGATASSYNATSTGSYTCAVTNACGTTTSNTITVTSGAAPSTPTAISGNNKACPSTQEIYSVTAVSGVTFNWTAPAASIVISGQGTPTVTVSYASNFSSGTLSVTASNGCGTSAARTKSISKNNRCGAAPATVAHGIDRMLDAVIYPNPSPDHFTLSILTNDPASCTVILHDMTGRVVERKENISPGESVEFGKKLSSGVYLVEVIQGEERKVLRVVKSQ